MRGLLGVYEIGGHGLCAVAIAELLLLSVQARIDTKQRSIVQGLLFWLFRGSFKASSGTVLWYRSSYGTNFENSEIASPVV